MDKRLDLQARGQGFESSYWQTFFPYFYLVFSWQLFLKKYFSSTFLQFFMHFSTHYDTSSWSNHGLEFIKFRSAFASLCFETISLCPHIIVQQSPHAPILAKYTCINNSGSVEVRRIVGPTSLKSMLNYHIRAIGERCSFVCLRGERKWKPK